MIPALDTFENMRECLGAISVTLPTAADLLSAQPYESQCNEEAAAARPRCPATLSRLVPIPKSRIRFLHLRRSRERRSVHITSTIISTKSWSHRFTTTGPVSDSPYFEALANMGYASDPLTTFLEDSESSTPCWNAKVLKRFCEKELAASISAPHSENVIHQRAWYWHASSHESDHIGWIPISDLSHEMWNKVNECVI